METTERIDWIEKSLLHLSQEDTAKDLLLLALITAHPNPAAVKAALQIVLSDFESTASDLGFGHEWAPQRVQDMNTAVRAVVERWLRKIP